MMGRLKDRQQSILVQPAVGIESDLAGEKLLEDMIVAAPEILSDDWMIVGRQEDTGLGAAHGRLTIPNP